MPLPVLRMRINGKKVFWRQKKGFIFEQKALLGDYLYD